MKAYEPKFFIIKFIIFNIVNFFAFAISYFIGVISGFAFGEGQEYIRVAIVSGVTFAIFMAYIYNTTVNMKESRLSSVTFIIREVIAYAVFLILPTAAAHIIGIENVMNNLLLHLYLPNLFGAHLTGIPVLGALIQTAVFALTVTPAHLKNRKKWAEHHLDEERKKREDAEYAEKLLAEQEEEKDLD